MFISNQPKKPLGISPYRCDQCAHHRSYCDRLLPSCSRCIKRKVACTLLRKVRKKATFNPEIDQLTVKFRINNNQIQNQSFKDSFSPLFRNEMPSSFINAVSRHLGNPPMQTTREILAQISNRAVTYNLYSLVWFPSIDKSSPSLDIFIVASTVLNSYMWSSNTGSAKLVTKPYYVLNPYLEEGVNLYFKHFGRDLFLFTKKSFYSKPRTRSLILSVSLTGYSSLEDNKIDSKVIEQMHTELNQLITREVFNPSFGTLQALIILGAELIAVPWVRKSFLAVVGLAEKIAQSVGLYHPDYPKGLSKSDKIERILAFNHFGFNKALLSFTTRFLTNVLADEEFHPVKSPCTLFYSQLPCDYQPYMIRLIKSDFYGSIAPCIQEIYYNQQAAILGKRTLSEIRFLLNKLSQKINLISIKKIKKLYKLKKSYEYLPEEINLAISLINGFHHFVLFRNYSLIVYPNFQDESNLNLPELQLALNSSSQVIRAYLQVKPSDLGRYEIMIIGQCLPFLIRYKHKSIDYTLIEDIITKAFNLLNSINTNLILQKLANINLMIPNIMNKLNYKS